MKRNITDAAHFRQFALTLEKQIENIKEGGLYVEEDVIATQKRQVEKLAELETAWRLAVLDHELGVQAYTAFVEHIKNVRKNILAARPYFRERQPVFTAHISPALKYGNIEGLFPHHINWTFINFAMNAVDWPEDCQVTKLAKEIATIRDELVIINLPLAISRSRIFWSRTPQSHITFMDFVSIAAEGLLAAIDKFVLPYSDVWCSVAIGRMVGNFIEAYSETTLHFYPTDRRKIYRANKFLSKCSAKKREWTVDDVVDAVNTTGTKTDEEEPKKRQVTSSAEISNLLAAATSIRDTSNIDVVDEYRPDAAYEMSESISVMKTAINQLTILDKKILALKGVRA